MQFRHALELKIKEEEEDKRMQEYLCLDTTDATKSLQALRRDFLTQFAFARIVNNVPRATVQSFKRQLEALSTHLQQHTFSRIRQEMPGFSMVEMLGDVFDLTRDSFMGRDTEFRLLREHGAYVKPVERKLGTDKTGETFVAYDSPFEQTLEAMFTNPQVWAAVKSFSERARQKTRRKEWATSGSFDEEHTINDIEDGVEFSRFMENLQLQHDEYVLPFLKYYDGLEVVNGLGQARTTYELACFYWALVCMPPEVRLLHKNLRMGTVCYKRALSKLGVEPVIDGFWGACMRRLKAGIKLQTPDGVRTFRGGTVLLAADTPAAAQLTGTKEAVGPSTFSICRNCHCEQTRMRTPNSFVAELPGWRARCGNRKAEFRQRSKDDLKEYLAKVQQMLDGKLKKVDLDLWMMSMGVNSFCTALTCVPYYSPVNGSPHDPMHIVFEGIARQLLGALSFYLKKWGVDLMEIPARLSAWARGTGRCRAHYPYMNTSRCVFTDANARAHTRKHY
jgi:hypothetical protein